MDEISIDTSSLNEVSSDVDQIIQQYTSGKSCMEALLSDIPEEAANYNISEYVNQYNAAAFSLDTIRGHAGNILSAISAFDTGIQFRDTVGVALLSLLEGGLSFGQDIYKLLTVLESATWSVATVPMDAINYIGSLLTGGRYKSLTEELWDATGAEISKNYVTSAFNKFYDSKGKTLKENAAAFENVRGVSSVIGTAAADAVFTYLTFGLGKAATGATEASSGLKNFVKLTKNSATLVSQTGSAMDKGTSVNRSLAYGTVFVAANMALGGASGKFNEAAATVGEKTESVLLKKGITTAATSVNSAVKTEVQTDTKLIYDYDSDQSFVENVKEQHEGEGDKFVEKMVAANVTSNMPSSTSSSSSNSDASNSSSDDAK